MIKSLSILWLGSILGSGSTFVIYLILARKLGVENFGIFSSTLSIVNIFSLFAGFGIAQVWLKLFGEEGINAVRWIKPSLYFVLMSVIGVSILLILWSIYGPHSKEITKILLIFLFFLYGNTIVQLVISKLQLEEKYSKLAMWQIIPNILRLVVLIVCFYLFSMTLEVIDIAYIYAGVGILISLFGLYQLTFMSESKLELKGHFTQKVKNKEIPTVKDIISHSWAFGMATLFAFVYIQSDIILVKYISGNVEAGYYNVAFIIITTILIFPSVLYSKFLMPKFHRWANHDKDKFYYIYKKGNIIMLISGTIIMLCILLLSQWGIKILFGSEYNQSVVLLNILSVALPIYFVAYSVGATLVTKNNMKIKVQMMGIVAFINIILNLLLIPSYGAKGAATATVISNIILLYLYYMIANKKIFNNKEHKSYE
jgi:O-antigen/teichoic acid export membrane protein